jgi:hypothetical protein
LCFRRAQEKSLLVAELIRSARKANPNARIVVLTASKELVVRNADELRRLCPDETVSMYNAALGLREASGMVIFGTIQSMYNKFHELVPPPPDLLIMDEAHHGPRRGDSMYGRFISACTAANEELQIVCLTATPFRMTRARSPRTSAKRMRSSRAWRTSTHSSRPWRMAGSARSSHGPRVLNWTSAASSGAATSRLR